MILIDTHVLVWLDQGSDRLGKDSRKLIDAALAENELVVASISFWEIAMLVEKKRLTFTMNLADWRNDLLINGLNEFALKGDVGIVAARLTDFHGDPADRIIIATALSTAAKIVTADEKILSWQGGVECCDARL